MQTDLNVERAFQETRQIGVSRPAMPVEDLPSPEEVFKVRRIRLEEFFLMVSGPAFIALCVSLGSGAWQIGPVNIGQFGFRGIGWIILVSAILQVFYNVELARFTVATGEPPIVAFGRIPPGYLFWVPFALLTVFASFIWGGWSVSAGASFFALINGRPHQPVELNQVRLMGVGLMLTTFLIVIFGRKISRTLEIGSWMLLTFVLTSLVIVTLTIVPPAYTLEAVASLVIPSRPPVGTSPTMLGALAGFTALASGLNYMFINYYRDKGFGMGFRAGAIGGLFGGRQQPIQPIGRVFREDEKNAALWKRWFRFLLIDQWMIYFVGVLVGMIFPSILVGYLSSLPGAPAPTTETSIVYAAMQLSQRFGPVLYGWALVIGFLFLFSTQAILLELLSRNLTDGVFGTSAIVRRWTKDDARKIYFPVMAILVVVIGAASFLAVPGQLILISANLANFAALVFPLVLIYLNLQLPRPARITWWSILVLLANAVFFGFFFVNFVAVQLTGQPWILF